MNRSDAEEQRALRFFFFSLSASKSTPESSLIAARGKGKDVLKWNRNPAEKKGEKAETS